MSDAVDFILYLVEAEKEEKLEYIWIHSDSGKTFNEWKKEALKKDEKNKPKRKKIDKEKEQEALNLAEEILGK